MAATFKEHIREFDLDTYLNPIVPPNQVKHLPTFISRWLGYRPVKRNEPPVLVSQLFAFIGAFLGLLVVGAIYKYAPGISQYNPPVLIASLGASAILEYNAITTPLSQPRNSLVGHAICAVIGVGISKAFQHNFSNFEDIKWIAGALACAISSFATGVTNTVHPPGGATAVLACVEAQIIAMGWHFIPVILTGVVVMLGVALITNNITRQFPTYWWSPGKTGSLYERQKQKQHDEEEHPVKGGMDEKVGDEYDHDHNHDHDDSASDTTLRHTKSHESASGIYLSSDQLILPVGVRLSLEECNMLRLLQSKLKARGLTK